MSEDLFRNTVKIYNEYSFKIDNVNDSSELNRIINEFEKNITDLNYSYPPNTDLLMTEEENDSIIKLNHKFRLSIDYKIKELTIDSIFD